ncbi:hypothetical protein MLGJGCBP_01282 [Rhodococcus sp. T7]|nr:site-specific recombinase [Rhodococcus opacus RKJ300 = JCM 13270]KAF0965584.1 hypothetical protein MLGJGCBP_01282 [Rhodococcus sp. T7]
MAQLALVLLALFRQMERTYAVERAAHARSVATEKGRRVGRPSVVTDAQLAYAIQLRNDGATVAEITDKTGLTRSILYRRLPQQPSESVMVTGTECGSTSTVAAEQLRAQIGPMACPTCGHLPTTAATPSPTATTSLSSGCTSTPATVSASDITGLAVSPTATSWWSAAADVALLPAPRPATNCRNRS